MKCPKKIIAITLIIGILLGFALGYTTGAATTLRYCVRLGKQLVDIDIDESKLVEMMTKYRYKIDNELGLT